MRSKETTPMVLSMWKNSLVIAVACTGLTLAQEPARQSSSANSASPEGPQQFVTVQEGGKPAQRCRVLGSWKTSEGARAYKVKALDTGEIMTIVESGPTLAVPGA